MIEEKKVGIFFDFRSDPDPESDPDPDPDQNDTDPQHCCKNPGMLTTTIADRNHIYDILRF